jgi:hypothetical protein
MSPHPIGKSIVERLLDSCKLFFKSGKKFGVYLPGKEAISAIRAKARSLKGEDDISLTGAHVKEAASDVIMFSAQFAGWRNSPFNLVQAGQFVRFAKNERLYRKVIVLNDLGHLM